MHLALASALTKLPHHDREFVVRALDFAKLKHHGQLRKGKGREPYVLHCERVVRYLLEAGVLDAGILAAAALHDTLEDTDTTSLELAQHFGETVADLVEDVTDDKALPHSARKHAQIMAAAKLSDAAALVKLADKKDNLKSLNLDPPPKWDYDKRAAYVGWAMEVVGRLVQDRSMPSKTRWAAGKLAEDCAIAAQTFWELTT